MTSSFFEPSMNVLLFLMVKKFVYLEVLLILAGVKAALRTGTTRYFSVFTIGICIAGIAAHFVVPYFQIYQQPWAGIAQFLTQSGHLNFTFALVELNLYEADGLGQLLIPKTLAKTTEIGRMSVEVPPGMALTRIVEPDEATPVDLKKEQKKQFFMDFWKKFIKELEFDDPGQPMPNLPTAENLYVYPGPTKKAWISAYFARSQGRVGVYFRTQKDSEGQLIWDALNFDETFLEEAFSEEVALHWKSTGSLAVRHACADFNDEANQQAIRDFFQRWLNTFVNVLRPRIKKILK